MRSGVADVAGPGVRNPDDRIVGRHLRIVAVVAAEREAVEILAFQLVVVAASSTIFSASSDL